MRCSRALMLVVAVAAVVAGCGSTASTVMTTPPCEAVAGGWEICDLGTLGGDDSAAVAVNERGQVVGTAAVTPPPRPGQGEGVISHAFLWEDGELRDLGSLGGNATDAAAINDRGQVVGSSQTASGAQHAFLWENGTMHDLAPMTSAYGINDRGQVVGISVAGDALLREGGETTTVASDVCDLSLWLNERAEVLGGCGPSAFVWRAGRTTTLMPLPGGRNIYPGALNTRGQVVGQSSVASRHWHAFVWEDGRMTDLVGAAFADHDSNAVAVNDRGQVAGFDEQGVFVWQNGRRTNLGVEPDTEATYAASFLDINSRGHVVGTTIGGDAFIWAGGRLRILHGLGQDLQDEGTASALNDDDLVVGTSVTPEGKTHAVVWRRAAA